MAGLGPSRGFVEESKTYKGNPRRVFAVVSIYRLNAEHPFCYGTVFGWSRCRTEERAAFTGQVIDFADARWWQFGCLGTMDLKRKGSRLTLEIRKKVG